MGALGALLGGGGGGEAPLVADGSGRGAHLRSISHPPVRLPLPASPVRGVEDWRVRLVAEGCEGAAVPPECVAATAGRASAEVAEAAACMRSLLLPHNSRPQQ